jgi:hypothetical protein
MRGQLGSSTTTRSPSRSTDWSARSIVRQLGRAAVELVPGVEAREGVREHREKLRVGVAAREVADARRERGDALDPHGRGCRDRRSARAVGDDEAALLQVPVGGRHRRGAHLEAGGQLADRGKPRGRGQASFRDLGLDGRGDGCCAGTAADRLY